MADQTNRPLGAKARLGKARGQYNKARQAGWCLAAEFDPAGCSGRVIRAHSVQKSRGLSTIAEGGHVMAIGPQGGAWQCYPVGINRASTFRGFCAKHDNQLFAELDDRDVRPTRLQAFLLGFRALAHESHKKAVEVSALPAMESAHRCSDVKNPRGAELIEAFRLGNEEGHGEMHREHEAAWQQLHIGDFSAVACVAYRLTDTPNVVGAGWVSSEFDFQGRRVQDLRDFSRRVDGTVFFSLPFAGGGGVIGLGWLTRSKATNLLFRSTLRLTDEEAPHALLRFGVSLSENLYYAPSFWRELSADEEAWFYSRARLGTPTQPIDARSLLEDGRRIVSWSVVERIVVPPTGPIQS